MLNSWRFYWHVSWEYNLLHCFGLDCNGFWLHRIAGNIQLYFELMPVTCHILLKMAKILKKASVSTNNLNICVFKAFTLPERYRPASGLLTMYTATGNTSVDDGPRDSDVETATPKRIQGRKSTLIEDIDQSEWGQVVVEWTLMQIVQKCQIVMLDLTSTCSSNYYYY